MAGGTAKTPLYGVPGKTGEEGSFPLLNRSVLADGQICSREGLSTAPSPGATIAPGTKQVFCRRALNEGGT